ncbi:MAG: hypothetical protein ACOYWZ_07035 [Bacillota bacterium]
MIWFFFFVGLSILSFVLVPKNKWKRLWPAGIIGSVVLYLIDTTLIRLGAFSFAGASPALEGLPIFYFASGFWGAILFINYFPKRNVWTFPYIILSSTLLLILEFFLVLTDNFYYHKWNLTNSLLLNVFGFTLISWLVQWVESMRLKPVS